LGRPHAQSIGCLCPRRLEATWLSGVITAHP
jgi:hypothetical protein